MITGDQVHDSKVMIDLLEDAGEAAAVVADKAYSSRSTRQYIADQGSLAVIPTKSNARNPIPHDKALLPHAQHRAVLLHNERHEAIDDKI
jgi:IS5 family transposase